MKKCSSVVWQFFDRVEENNRCVAVLCKLCDTVYKYFGNTTNLRVHLVKKHPIQWEFQQANPDCKGPNDPSTLKFVDEESNLSTISTAKRASRQFTNVRKQKDSTQYTLSIKSPDRDSAGAKIPEIEIQRVDTDPFEIDNENEDDDAATLNMVRQLHEDQTDEEWLEDDTPLDVIKGKRKKIARKIKREVMSPTHWARNYPVQNTPKKLMKQETPSSKDEYSIFGEYIANKLRKFKAPRTRGNIQQLITTILWQAEYGMYDDADSVKRILLSSMQINLTEQHQEQSGTVEEYTLQHVEQSAADGSADEHSQSVETEVAMMG